MFFLLHFILRTNHQRQPRQYHYLLFILLLQLFINLNYQDNQYTLQFKKFI